MCGRPRFVFLSLGCEGFFVLKRHNVAQHFVQVDFFVMEKELLVTQTFLSALFFSCSRVLMVQRTRHAMNVIPHQHFSNAGELLSLRYRKRNENRKKIRVFHVNFLSILFLSNQIIPKHSHIDNNNNNKHQSHL